MVKYDEILLFLFFIYAVLFVLSIPSDAQIPAIVVNVNNFDKYFIKAHVTDWIDNPYTIGAWSSALPGKAKLRKVLKKSVKNKIFFAGEATAGAYGTVHGADRSGKRAVKELLKKVKI